MSGDDQVRISVASPPAPQDFKEIFSEELVEATAELWRRIHDGEIKTKDQQEFVFTELMQYNAVMQTKLDLRRVDTLSSKCLGCHCRGEDDITAQRTYSEAKEASEVFRSLSFLFILELLTLVTDIVFLFTLEPLEPDLFWASLVVLSVCILCRLFNSLLLFSRVERSLIWLYLIGLIITLFETNTGLALIKLSLKRTDEDGEIFFDDEGNVKRRDERNVISVFARNESNAGWAQLRYIFVVTMLEDVPQLVIQFFFILRQEENTDLIWFFTFVTTLMHIVYQWIEAFVTLRFLTTRLCCFSHPTQLSNLDVGREMIFENQTTELKERSSILPWIFVTYKAELGKALREFRKDVRSLNLIRYEDSAYAVNQIVQYCSWLAYITFNGCDLQDQDGQLLVRSCSYLTHFSLENCRLLSDDGIQVMIENSRYFRAVNLSSTKISDNALKALSRHCPLLEIAILSNCGVTDEGLAAMARGCKKLVLVDLSGTSVTNAGIEELANHCPNIQMLILIGTGVTKDFAEGLNFPAMLEPPPAGAEN